ncbi:MAG: rhodanese-like domain-containing protein [Planctomycetes bacterium]|nr:rhodanese-like domain-containing protein [Planctomycetota bacterium]
MTLDRRLLPAALALVFLAAPTPGPDGPLHLPEPIDAAMLAKVLLDQPGAYTVLDIRPAAQFAEWTIPGAKNVGLDTLAAHVAALPASARVVLVDRDGTFAFAAAGALMERLPERPLRALVGGLQRYHHEIVLRAGATSMPAATPAAAPMAPTDNPTAPKAKRSAGC